VTKVELFAVVFVLAQHRLAEGVGIRRFEGIEDDSGFPQGFFQGPAEPIRFLDGHDDIPLVPHPAQEGFQIRLRDHVPPGGDRGSRQPHSSADEPFRIRIDSDRIP